MLHKAAAATGFEQQLAKGWLMPVMSMPTKGKHHHLAHHHQQQQQHQSLQHQHQHPIILNVSQPVVPHTPQSYSAVVTTNTHRFLSNAGKYHLLLQFLYFLFLRNGISFVKRIYHQVSRVIVKQ